LGGGDDDGKGGGDFAHHHHHHYLLISLQKDTYTYLLSSSSLPPLSCEEGSRVVIRFFYFKHVGDGFFDSLIRRERGERAGIFTPWTHTLRNGIVRAGKATFPCCVSDTQSIYLVLFIAHLQFIGWATYPIIAQKIGESKGNGFGRVLGQTKGQAKVFFKT